MVSVTAVDAAVCNDGKELVSGGGIKAIISGTSKNGRTRKTINERNSPNSNAHNTDHMTSLAAWRSRLVPEIHSHATSGAYKKIHARANAMAAHSPAVDAKKIL